MSSVKANYKTRGNFIIEPKKFSLWVFLVTITMLFAAFTSAMIVRRAAGNWTYFEIPVVFSINAVITILSSITMQLAYHNAKKDEIKLNRRYLLMTIVLGIIFLLGQVYGFYALIQSGVYVIGNPSGSFFYVIPLMHGLHVVGGVIYLISTLLSSLKFKVHSRSMLKINLCTTYWHFIGGLWLYLFAILTVLR
jgi:cytochrome c oxidase subunit 3